MPIESNVGRIFVRVLVSTVPGLSQYLNGQFVRRGFLIESKACYVAFDGPEAFIPVDTSDSVREHIPVIVRADEVVT